VALIVAVYDVDSVSEAECRVKLPGDVDRIRRGTDE
jgi:hypothetical protein